MNTSTISEAVIWRITGSVTKARPAIKPAAQPCRRQTTAPSSVASPAVIKLERKISAWIDSEAMNIHSASIT